MSPTSYRTAPPRVEVRRERYRLLSTLTTPYAPVVGVVPEGLVFDDDDEGVADEGVDDVVDPADVLAVTVVPVASDAACAALV